MLQEGNGTNGLPCGALLGPILHNLFLNDEKRLNSEVTRLFRRKNRGGSGEELQKDFNKVSDWVINQQKKLNVDKCSDAHGKNNSSFTL